MFRVLALATLVFAVGYTYLGWSLAGEAWIGWVALAVPFLMVLALPLTVWGRDRRANVKWKDVVAHGAYAGMGVLTYVFLFTVLRDGLFLASGWRAPWWAVLVASACALVAGAFVALLGPKVKRVELFYPDLHPDLEGFKIAQITDLHIGGLMNREYVSRVVAKTNALLPDAVALTGDIGDGDSDALVDAIAPLGELAPRERVFYVTGNHEYYWNVAKWLARFRAVGVQVLENSSALVPARGARVFIAGTPDRTAADLKVGPGPDAERAFAGGPSADFRILLAHRPGVARRAAAIGYDLLLAGHTHGGQFFPWTLVVRAVHEFHEGLRRVDRMWVYVSHGTGTWGPPLRLGTVPEVTLLTLRRGGSGV